MSSINFTIKSGTSESVEKFGSSKASSHANSRPAKSNAKFEVEKFNGPNNLGMWECEI